MTFFNQELCEEIYRILEVRGDIRHEVRYVHVLKLLERRSPEIFEPVNQAAPANR